MTIQEDLNCYHTKQFWCFVNLNDAWICCVPYDQGNLCDVLLERSHIRVNLVFTCLNRTMLC